jgi:hypothetical protein
MKQKEAMSITNKKMNIDMKLPQRKRTPGLTAGRFKMTGCASLLAANGRSPLSPILASSAFCLLAIMTYFR